MAAVFEERSSMISSLCSSNINRSLAAWISETLLPDLFTCTLRSAGRVPKSNARWLTSYRDLGGVPETLLNACGTLCPWTLLSLAWIFWGIHQCQDQCLQPEGMLSGVWQEAISTI